MAGRTALAGRVRAGIGGAAQARRIGVPAGLLRRPREPDLQPTIAPDGTSANSTSGCGDSDLLSPLPTGTPKIDQIATLPPASGKGKGKKQCMSRRSFTIRLKEPRGDALLSAVGPDGHWQAQVPHLRRLAQRAGQAQALSGG